MGRSSDFKFWEESLPVHHHSCGDEGDLYEVGGCSPPMWRRASGPESSSLLPQNHHYSCLSPTSRIRAIIDGQRELMEMIRDMPESSYELSLKDMVDQQNKEDVQENEVVEAEEDIVKHKRENRVTWRAKANTKICRSESMESEVFQLKLFVPVSLSSKKTKTRKHPRKCPGQVSEEAEKQTNKDWWKIIFLAIKNTHKNTNIISNRTSEKKNKSRRRRGCLF